MKRVLLVLTLAVAFLSGYSQMVVDGGNVVVQAGATLVIEGDLTLDNSGDIQYDGDANLKGDFINNGGTVNASSVGTLSFQGSADQEIKGTDATTFYGTVEVNNGNNVVLNGQNTTVSALDFQSGMVQLGSDTLTIASGGSISNADASNHVQTNGDGVLVREVPGANTNYPVGNSAYNPIALVNSGTTNFYGVRVIDGLPGSFVSDNHAVDRTWRINEYGAGGNLTAIPVWNGAEEQADFDRLDAAIGVTGDGGSTFAWSPTTNATGTDPYTIAGAGFTSVGEFIVADYYHNDGIELDANMFLAGPYSGGTMSTALNAQIPLTDPYGTGLTLGSIPAGAVDWIKVELRDKADNTSVLKTFAVFVDANGQILHTDGTADAKFTGTVKDQYFVVVDHRNHLGVMSNATVDFASGTGVFDFTTGTLFGTNPAKDITGGGIYGLWAGDTDGDGTVQLATGSSDITPINSEVSTDPGNPTADPTFVGAATYSNADADLNSFVELATGSSDITPISSSVSNNPANPTNDPTVFLTAQLP